MTPVLYASSLNNFDAFKILIEFPGCNIYTFCNQLMNPLHYAVLNQSRDMIKFLISADAESEWLISSKDKRGKTPR
jgi:ankyrin repeat protein